MSDAGILRREKGALESLLRRVFEIVDAGLAVCGSDLVVQEANLQAIGMLGGTGGVGRPVSELLGAAWPEMEWIFHSVLRSGRTRKATFSVRGPEPRCLNLTVALLEEPDGIRLLLHLTDITEEIREFQKRAQTEKMAAVGLLAAGIAHEFNNIWASVQGYAELAWQAPDYQAQLVDVALEQANRASEIIHSLLSFSDMRMEMKPGVHLGRILSAIQRLVSLEMRAKGIDLSFETRDDPPVNGNEGMLQQVFLNLVINAYQSLVGKGSIGITLSREGSYAVVRVRDTGRGMTPAQLGRIFEPFYTTKGALGGQDAEHDGHGLGLTLTYNVVRMHRGDITVESEPGKGTVFVVRLPAGEEAQKDPSSTAIPIAVPLNLRILIIEDETILSAMVSHILSKHRVSTAARADEAIRWLEQEPFDLVLLDLVLHDSVDGFELLTCIRERWPATRIVLMTGRLTDPRVEEARKAADGFIAKPFAIRDIHHAVAKALVRRGKTGG